MLASVDTLAWALAFPFFDMLLYTRVGKKWSVAEARVQSGGSLLTQVYHTFYSVFITNIPTPLNIVLK